jgi:hypothetical protein
MQAMNSPEPTENAADEAPAGGRTLTPEAARALAEAAERRAAIDAHAAEIAATRERQGRGVRYDDWEIKGIAVDF